MGGVGRQAEKITDFVLYTFWYLMWNEQLMISQQEPPAQCVKQSVCQCVSGVTKE